MQKLVDGIRQFQGNGFSEQRQLFERLAEGQQRVRSPITSEVRLIDGAVSHDLLRNASTSSDLLVALEKGLRIANVLRNSEQLVSYQDRFAWRLGGSETYVSQFDVVVSEAGNYAYKRLIAKAAVRFGEPSEYTIRQWLRRQARLNDFSVATARCYGHRWGILFQELISHSFTSWFLKQSEITQRRFSHLLTTTAQRIERAGFAPVGLIRDLRTDGSKLFVIDFGEDLGEYTHGRHFPSATREVARWRRQMGLSAP